MKSEVWVALKELWEFIKEFGFLFSPLLTLFLPPVRKGLVRFLKQSYPRYCKELSNRFKNTEPFESYPALNLQEKSAQSTQKEVTLSEILKSKGAAHIQGKPGSGKTSLIKKHLIELCSNHYLTRPKLIPVYVKYSSDNLFNEILNTLDVNELFKDPTLFDVDWLKKQLKKKSFLIIIDDVHNILSNEAKRAQSKIDSLLEYRKNKFVLISRDYYSACPFQLNLYQIQDLSNNRNIAEQILKVHAGEERFEQIWMHLQYGYKKELLKLYDTPQLLKLLAKVFDQKERFDDNKSFLFKRFLKSRHANENRKLNEVLPLELKKKVLCLVAYSLFIQYSESAYSVLYDDFREVLSQNVQEIQDRFGYIEYSVDSIMDGLKQEGYLIQIDDRIQFEHDQWQEFFAALEIHREEESIAPLLSGNFGKEIAMFVSGLYLLEEEIPKRDFWRRFWEELVLSDFFLTKWCLSNRVSYTLAEVQEVYESFTYSKEDLVEAYNELATWYQKIINLHFPNLSYKFAPKDSNIIGVLVEQNENKVGLWYGYRSLSIPKDEKVVVTDQKKIMNLINVERPIENAGYYRNHYGVTYQHAYMGTSAVHGYPAKIAFDDVKSQLTDFIQTGELVETEIMKEEALFIEAVSLSKMIQGQSSRISNTSKQDVLPIGELLSGLQKLINDDFHRNIKVPESTLSHGGLPKRDVKLEDFESRLRQHIQRKQLKAGDKLISPNADLIDVIKNYRFRKDELSSEHRDFLIERSVIFYKELYQNYKKVLGINFPTAISHFRTSFPVQVFLIKKGERRKRFGEKLIYFDVKELSAPVDVKIVDEEVEDKIKSDYYGYYGLGTFWGLKSFSMIEPIRNAVYQLIKDEYEKLDRQDGHRVI